MKKHLIVIAGPTAVGKTSTAIQIAQKLNTEIISADSRQFYREMPIGTAAPCELELNTVPHHFIANLSINDQYDVYKYSVDAIERIEELHRNHDHIVLCGGSGLYIKAVLEGIDLLPDPSAELRQELKLLLQNEGKEKLLEKLIQLDPVICKTIDINNPARIIRALEVCITAGIPYSSLLKKKPIIRNFETTIIGLDMDREILYQRINARVEEMIGMGLTEEVKNLISFRHLAALNTVGYKEIFSMLDGTIGLDEAINLIKANTRKYARKQLTWFRSQKDIQWFHPENIDEILQKIR